MVWVLVLMVAASEEEVVVMVLLTLVAQMIAQWAEVAQVQVETGQAVGLLQLLHARGHRQ